MHDGKLIIVFSTPNYCDQGEVHNNVDCEKNTSEVKSSDRTVPVTSSALLLTSGAAILPHPSKFSYGKESCAARAMNPIHFEVQLGHHLLLT
ncbi:hypothetical protein ZWY2020_050730 [Hordeum vulgare]|nr:hypothetical protein ZWY2020_050730 [Hordeum vulgare]